MFGGGGGNLVSGNLGRVSSTGGGEGGWKLPPKEIEDGTYLVTETGG